LKWRLTLGKYFDKNAIAKGGMFDLSPGGCLMVQNEGKGLTDDLWAAVEACRVRPIGVFYSSLACELLADGDTIIGMRMRQMDGFRISRAGYIGLWPV
jgi:hypothetical protein